MPAEKQFENKIKAFLTEQGCWYIKYFANAFTKSGIPDILGATPNGKFFAIEVKAANGRPSPLQIYNIEELKKLGAYAIILYPKDFETFKKEFSKFCQNTN